MSEIIENGYSGETEEKTAEVSEETLNPDTELPPAPPVEESVEEDKEIKSPEIKEELKSIIQEIEENVEKEEMEELIKEELEEEEEVEEPKEDVIEEEIEDGRADPPINTEDETKITDDREDEIEEEVFHTWQPKGKYDVVKTEIEYEDVVPIDVDEVKEPEPIVIAAPSTDDTTDEIKDNLYDGFPDGPISVPRLLPNGELGSPILIPEGIPLLARVLPRDEDANREKIPLERLFTPATDSGHISPKKKKAFASSDFYAKGHPTIDDQLQLAQRISESLLDQTNKTSKGQAMYERRKEKSEKWIHQEGTEMVERSETKHEYKEEAATVTQECEGRTQSDSTTKGRIQSSSTTKRCVQSSSTNKAQGYEISESDSSSKQFSKPALKLVMNPKGVQDHTTVEQHYQQLLEESSLTSTAPYIPAGGVQIPASPEIAKDLINDMQSPTGKGAALFAKRKKRMDKFIVDETNVQKASAYSVEPQNTLMNFENTVQNQYSSTKTSSTVQNSSVSSSVSNKKKTKQERDKEQKEIMENLMKSRESQFKMVKTPWESVLETGSASQAFQKTPQTNPVIESAAPSLPTWMDFPKPVPIATASQLPVAAPVASPFKPAANGSSITNSLNSLPDPSLILTSSASLSSLTSTNSAQANPSPQTTVQYISQGKVPLRSSSVNRKDTEKRLSTIPNSAKYPMPSYISIAENKSTRCVNSPSSTFTNTKLNSSNTESFESYYSLKPGTPPEVIIPSEVKANNFVGGINSEQRSQNEASQKQIQRQSSGGDGKPSNGISSSDNGIASFPNYDLQLDTSSCLDHVSNSQEGNVVQALTNSNDEPAYFVSFASARDVLTENYSNNTNSDDVSLELKSSNGEQQTDYKTPTLLNSPTNASSSDNSAKSPSDGVIKSPNMANDNPLPYKSTEDHATNLRSQLKSHEEAANCSSPKREVASELLNSSDRDIENVECDESSFQFKPIAKAEEKLVDEAFTHGSVTNFASTYIMSPKVDKAVRHFPFDEDNQDVRIILNDESSSILVDEKSGFISEIQRSSNVTPVPIESNVADEFKFSGIKDQTDLHMEESTNTDDDFELTGDFEEHGVVLSKTYERDTKSETCVLNKSKLLNRDSKYPDSMKRKAVSNLDMLSTLSAMSKQKDNVSPSKSTNGYDDVKTSQFSNKFQSANATVEEEKSNDSEAILTVEPDVKYGSDSNKTMSCESKEPEIKENLEENTKHSDEFKSSEVNSYNAAAFPSSNLTSNFAPASTDSNAGLVYRADVKVQNTSVLPESSISSAFAPKPIEVLTKPVAVQSPGVKAAVAAPFTPRAATTTQAGLTKAEIEERRKSVNFNLAAKGWGTFNDFYKPVSFAS